MKMIASSVVLSFLGFLNRRKQHLSRWKMHCKFAHVFMDGLFKNISGTDNGLCSFRKEKDLVTLSSLGHFLKGSSATLGLTKVKDSCEKIQHYGAKKGEDGTEDEPDEEKCLGRIKDTLVAVREEYAEVERSLKKFFASGT